MSAKPTTPSNKTTSPTRTGAIKASAVAKSGSNTRVRAHLKSANQRSQAKRDSR